jgi:glutamate racemase
MKAIGVFDSGVGGLTVLKALRRAMPHRDFLYLGDTARVPYGRKPPEMVREFAREITAFLAERGAEAVIVACNTATAVALADLKREFSLPIWGVIEPGVEAAVRATVSGYVGVIGTKGTIRSGAYQERLEARGMRVWAQACPLFVHLVEEDLADSPEAEVVAKYYADSRLYALPGAGSDAEARFGAGGASGGERERGGGIGSIDVRGRWGGDCFGTDYSLRYGRPDRL